MSGLARNVLEIGGGQAGQRHVLRRIGDEVAFRLAAFAEMDAGADIRAALQVAGRPQAGRVQGLQAQAESASRRFIPVRQVQEFAGHEHAADGLILQIVEVQRLCGVGFRTPQGPRRFRRFREIGSLFLGDAQRGRVGVALGAQARPGDIQRQGVDAAGGMAIVAGKGFGTEHGLVETEAFGQALVAPGIPVGQRAVVPSGDTPHSGHKAAGGSHAVPGVHAPRGRPGRDVGDQAVEEIGLDLKHQKLPQPPRPGRACRKRGLPCPAFSSSTVL